MFDAPIVQVAVGLIVVFFVFSTLCSGLAELVEPGPSAPRRVPPPGDPEPAERFGLGAGRSLLKARRRPTRPRT